MSHKKNTNLAPAIIEINYVKLADVSTIDFGSLPKSRIVNLNHGAVWSNIYFTPGKISFEEPITDSSAGRIWQQNLTLFFPGIDLTDKSDFDNYENIRFLVKFKYSNGDQYLIGTKVNPCKFSLNYSSNDGGSTISFYKNANQPAYILQV